MGLGVGVGGVRKLNLLHGGGDKNENYGNDDPVARHETKTTANGKFTFRCWASALWHGDNGRFKSEVMKEQFKQKVSTWIRHNSSEITDLGSASG